MFGSKKIVNGLVKRYRPRGNGDGDIQKADVLKVFCKDFALSV